MSSLSLRSNQAGFSLVEVIITMAIITILTTLVLFRYNAFNSAVLLKNQAYEIALDIRDAQVRAVSVRSDANEFREEYGVFFTSTAGLRQGINNRQYVLWQDNGTDSPPRFKSDDDTLLDVVTLDDRFFIRNIYINCNNVDYTTCPATTATLSISFARPNFDAQLVRGNGDEVDTVHIVVAPRDDPNTTRAVYVTSAGLVTVQ